MSSLGGFVCWEWRRDDGGYCPYTPEESNALEVAYTAKKRQCTVGSFTVDLQAMRQCKRPLGSERRVRRTIADLSHASVEITAYWTWCEYPERFVPYQIEATVDIELAFQSGSRQVNLEKCHSRLPYTINFHNMNQTRHHYMTKRDIKRVALPLGTSLQSFLKANASSVFTGTAIGSSTALGASATTVPPPSYSHTASPSCPYYTAGVGATFTTTTYPSTAGGGATFSTPSYPSVPSGGHTSVLGPSHAHTSAISKSGSAHLHAPISHYSGHVSTTMGYYSNPSTPGLSFTHTTPHVAGMGGHGSTISAPLYHHHLPSAMSASGGVSTPASTHYLPPSLAISSALPHHHHPFSTTTTMSAASGGYHPSMSSTPYPSAITTTTATFGASTVSKASASTKAITSVTSTTTSSKSKARSSRTRSGGGGKSSAVSSESSKPSSKSSSSTSTRGKSRGSARTKKSVGSKAPSSSSDPLDIYAKKLERLKPKHDEVCPICMNKLSEPSGFEDEVPASSRSSAAAEDTLNVYKLRKCGHKLHYACLTMYLRNSSKDGFICPTCKKPYGVKTGDMPNGEMTVQRYHSPLPGHSNHGTIVITYNFRPGTYKGKRYRANGFPRVCYLPDSPKGKKVLELLRVAWDRRLTFTIGTSVTTGTVDTVVWNEIHHKTESNSNHSGHGYPDPGYLDRVLLELAAQGVEDAKEEEEDLPTSSDSSEEEEEEKAGGDAKPTHSRPKWEENKPLTIPCDDEDL